MEVLSPEVVLVDEQLAEAARAALPEPPDVFEVLSRAKAGETVRKLRVSFNAQEAAAEADLARRRPWSRRRLGAVAIGAAVAVAATASAVVTLGRDEVTTARAQASNTPARTHPQAVASRTAPKQQRVTATAATRKPRRNVATTKPEPAQKPHRAAARRPAIVPRPPKAHAVQAKPARTPATPPAKAAPKVGSAAVRAQPAPVLTWPLQRQATYYRVAVYRLGPKPAFLFEVWTDKTRLAVPATWGEHNRLARGVYGWAVFPTYGALGEAPADRAAATPITGGRFTL